MKSVLRAIFLSGIVLTMFGATASAQTVGQISGVAAMPAKGTVAGATVQLRDLTTKQVIGTAKTNASGQFVFVVDHPGTFIVEILNEEGAVVGTTAPVVLTPGAMIVSAVAVSPTAGGAAAAAGGAAAGQAEQGQSQGQGQAQGSTTAAGAMAGAGASSGIFMSTLPSVSSAATGSGAAAGTVPSRGTASPSR